MCKPRLRASMRPSLARLKMRCRPTLGDGMMRRTVFVLAIVLAAASAVAQPIDKGEIHVSDGDTISVAGKVYRLVGFNVPETFRAKYAGERALGVKADKRLRELVADGNLDLTEVRCSCREGTHGTQACNYGRSCATLKAKGVDVGGP
jgi:endonuclease YncB( thermonuclease family)